MKKSLFIPVIILLFFTVFLSCKSTLNNLEPAQSQVEFSFSGSQLKTTNEQNLVNVVVTIEDLNDRVIKNSEKIEIYNMNGYYISKPISLVTGEYKLTRFMVLDANNNVVYASPLEESDKAYLVQKPLPILFSAQKDSVTKITPEVLSTEESIPQDFGYATFSFDVVKTFDFLVGAFIYNEIRENFELTTASISIYSDSLLVYSGQLQTNSGNISPNNNALGITNKITLPEKYGSFTLKISKSGYDTYVKTFSTEELKLQYRSEDKGPLIVILAKNKIDLQLGLIAYYPFIGNADDESGNYNQGTNHGASLTTDRKGSANSAYLFDGIDDYILVSNNAILCPASNITVSAWVYADGLANRHVLVDKRIDAFNYPYTSYELGTSNATAAQSWEAALTTNYSQVKIQCGPVTKVNKWYHLVLTYDGNNLSIFVNGVLKNSTIKTGDITYSNMDMFIGTNALNTNYMKGKIDDIRIYNRALSKEEIQALYNE